MVVTEQSHVLKCRMFWILISKVISGVFLFYLFDLLLLLFSDCRSYAVCGNWFRLGMAHFSVSCDSIASLFIFVRIGFEPCNNHYHYQQLLYCQAPLFAFVARCCVTYQGYLSLDPFFSIGASLKAVQCVNLRAKGRFSSVRLCFFQVFGIAPLSSSL